MVRLLYTHQTYRRDGKELLFTEAGEGGGPNYSVYQRKIGDTSAVRWGMASPSPCRRMANG